MIFLDSNIVIDVVERDRHWFDWSRAKIAILGGGGQLVTGTVVVAETAGRFDTLDVQLSFLRRLGARVHELETKAAYRAGVAHRAYRRAGGTRAAILADFLIGAHAVVLGATLLTRDRQRFAGYFPELKLITPETHP